MSDYTPTTDDVRGAYADGQWYARQRMDGTLEEFDRWLAAHDAEKRANQEAEQGEVDWEYGVGLEHQGRTFGFRMSDRLSAEGHIAPNPHEDEDFGPSYLRNSPNATRKRSTTGSARNGSPTYGRAAG